MNLTDIPLEQRYYGNSERTMGREVREGKFEWAVHYWCPTFQKWHSPGKGACDRVDCGQFWSRPIDVGEGFELVGLEEVLCDGDEFWLPDVQWDKIAASIGMVVRVSIDERFRNGGRLYAFRRRKKAEKAGECEGEKEAK